MSEVIRTTIVRDYQNGGQSITVDGYLTYCKWHVTCPNSDGSFSEGFDEVWFGIDGKVIRIDTHNSRF